MGNTEVAYGCPWANYAGASKKWHHTLPAYRWKPKGATSWTPSPMCQACYDHWAHEQAYKSEYEFEPIVLLEIKEMIFE